MHDALSTHPYSAFFYVTVFENAKATHLHNEFKMLILFSNRLNSTKIRGQRRSLSVHQSHLENKRGHFRVIRVFKTEKRTKLPRIEMVFHSKNFQPRFADVIVKFMIYGLENENKFILHG